MSVGTMLIESNDVNGIENCGTSNSDCNGIQLNQALTDNENLFLFRETIKNTMEQTISGFSEENFGQRFNKISIINRKPKIGLKLFNTFKMSTLDRVINQLDCMIQEEKMEEVFAAYSVFIEQNELEIENVKWRPPGNVTQHLRVPLILQKIKRKQELEQYVISKELEVNRLQNKVMLKRNKIISIETEMKNVLERNKNIVLDLEHFEEVLKPSFIKALSDSKDLI